VVSDQLLEEAGVLGDVSVSEWPLYFVPLADDMLSLELEDAVSDLYLVCLQGTGKFDLRLTSI
jgi:lysine-specific histone demethylase 1